MKWQIYTKEKRTEYEKKLKDMRLTLEFSSLWKRKVSPYGKMEDEFSSFESSAGITE